MNEKPIKYEMEASSETMKNLDAKRLNRQKT